jgi:hypothetical protein
MGGSSPLPDFDPLLPDFEPEPLFDSPSGSCTLFPDLKLKLLPDLKLKPLLPLLP